MYIAVTLFLGFGAVNTGNNLIYLIVSVFLSYMALSGFLGKRNLDHVAVHVDAPEDVHAGTEFPLAVRLTNRRRFLPVFLMHVVIGDRRVLFPFVAPGNTDTRHLSWVFDHRGRQHIASAYISSVFPFHFFVRRRRMDTSIDCIAYARMISCPSDRLADAEHRLPGQRALDVRGFDGEAIAVREYVPGDPLKYIHWKASARSGSLKTKELASLGQPPEIIDFEQSPIAQIEERISCITGAIVRAGRQGIPIGLKIGGRVFPATGTLHRQREMLKELAVYGLE